MRRLFDIQLASFCHLLSTSAASLVQGRTEPLKSPSLLWRLLQIVMLFGLLYWFSRSATLAGLLLVAGGISVGLVALASHILIRLLNRFSQSSSLGWRLAVRNVQRRMGENRLLLAGFTLASLMVMSIYYVRGDLIEQWRSQVPEGAANRFAMNIQEPQHQAFQQWLIQHQIKTSYMYPVVRGRVSAINGVPVSDAVNKDDEVAQRNLQREMNLTYRPDLPEGNEVIEGKFFDP